MRPSLRRRLSCLVGVGVFGLTVPLLAHVFADGKAPAPKAPKSSPPANETKSDGSKYVIELSTKRILAGQSAPASAMTVGEFVNPKVQPGKVRWHADFAAACRAARKSGKPVLLFQMMGNLDDRFC